SHEGVLQCSTLNDPAEIRDAQFLAHIQPQRRELQRHVRVQPLGVNPVEQHQVLLNGCLRFVLLIHALAKHIQRCRCSGGVELTHCVDCFIDCFTRYETPRETTCQPVSLDESKDL